MVRFDKMLLPVKLVAVIDKGIVLSIWKNIKKYVIQIKKLFSLT